MSKEHKIRPSGSDNPVTAGSFVMVILLFSKIAASTALIPGPLFYLNKQLHFLVKLTVYKWQKSASQHGNF